MTRKQRLIIRKTSDVLFNAGIVVHHEKAYNEEQDSVYWKRGEYFDPTHIARLLNVSFKEFMSTNLRMEIIKLNSGLTFVK